MQSVRFDSDICMIEKQSSRARDENISGLHFNVLHTVVLCQIINVLILPE
jgi:hypothetical protein